MTGIDFGDDHDALFGAQDQVDRQAVLVAVAQALKEMGRDPAEAWGIVHERCPEDGDTIDVLDMVEIVMGLQDMGWRPKPEAPGA